MDPTRAAEIRHPFQMQLSFPLPEGEFKVVWPFGKPPGTRMVIENITFLGHLPPDQILLAQVELSTSWGTARHTLVLTQQGWLEGAIVFAANHLTRLYVEVRASMALVVVRSHTDGSGNVEATLSGYLVDEERGAAGEGSPPGAG